MNWQIFFMNFFSLKIIEIACFLIDNDLKRQILQSEAGWKYIFYKAFILQNFKKVWSSFHIEVEKYMFFSSLILCIVFNNNCKNLDFSLFVAYFFVWNVINEWQMGFVASWFMLYLLFNYICYIIFDWCYVCYIMWNHPPPI